MTSQSPSLPASNHSSTFHLLLSQLDEAYESKESLTGSLERASTPALDEHGVLYKSNVPNEHGAISDEHVDPGKHGVPDQQPQHIGAAATTTTQLTDVAPISLTGGKAWQSSADKSGAQQQQQQQQQQQ
jgi:hypothetical protein